MNLWEANHDTNDDDTDDDDSDEDADLSSASVAVVVIAASFAFGVGIAMKRKHLEAAYDKAFGVRRTSKRALMEVKLRVLIDTRIEPALTK